MQSDEERDDRSIGESDDHSMKEIDCSMSPQERFIDAYRNGRWSVIRELLEAEPEIDINCHDEEGTNLLFCASDAPSEDLCYILERGPNPKLLTTSGLSVLCKTVVRGCLENMSLLLDFDVKKQRKTLPVFETQILVWKNYFFPYNARLIIITQIAGWICVMCLISC